MSRLCAFIVPFQRDHYVLWVESPSGQFMLLSGSWTYYGTVKLFALKCGYTLIDADVGMAIVDKQLEDRSIAPEYKPLKRIH